MRNRWNLLLAFVAVLGVLIAGCISHRVSYQPARPSQPVVKSEKYPDANAVIIFDSTRVELEPSGEYTWTGHKLVKILNNRGKERYGEAKFTYCSIYDTVLIRKARVIQRDGTVLEVPPGAIKDVPIPAFGKFFLPNVRMKIVTFPSVQEGCCVEVVFDQVMKNPPMENNFDDVQLFEDTEPILDRVYTVVAPRDMPLRYLVKNGELSFTKQEQGDKIVYSWAARDVPRVVTEVGMPPLSDVATKLLISTVPSWQKWSTWYYRLCKPKFEADDAIKLKVKELTTSLSSQEEKIRTLYYFVAQNIRYVETTLTGKKGGYEPFPAPKTFKNKYGVCRDKAALLVSMLKQIDVDAYIALTNPTITVEQDIPADQFNHAIVAVKDSNGEFFYLDPTAEDARDFLVAVEQNKGVLICDEDGEPLRFTALVPPEQNMGRILCRSTLDEHGTLRCKLTFTTNGFYDYILRSWMKYLPPARREMIWQQVISSISPNAVIDSINISNLKNLYEPAYVEIYYTAKDYVLKAGNFLIFRMPGDTEGLDFLAKAFLRGADLPVRRYPLKLWSTFASCVEETLRVPEGYAVKALPERVNAHYPKVSYQARYEAESGRITLIKKLLVSDIKIHLSDYPNLREVLSLASRASRGKVILVAEPQGGRPPE
ncbi:MAG: hypothetical protein DRQ24_08190 [Candidatus Latescibacterota bacterium]|nr:MAG: hypothetical protein DRQ24_08190 [Candidatus Latescibacterota bacterium]